MNRIAHRPPPRAIALVLVGLLFCLANCGGGKTESNGGTAPVAGPLSSPQNPADIIPPERRTTWNPGLNAVGGIPYRTTIYRTLSPSGGDDTATIQAALDNCPAGQVVKLAAGTFRISGSGLELTKSNITFRGSGPGTVLQKIDRPSSAFPIIVVGSRWSSDKMTNSVNLTTNGVKGSRTVVLASVPSPALYVGQLVYLDQYANSSKTDWGPQCTSASDACRSWFHRMNRPISQVVEVESINGTSITFTTPLHIDFPTADASQLSQYLSGGTAIPETRMSGIEDMTFTLGGEGNIELEHTSYCWVKNVESNHTIGSSVSMSGCFRCVLRDSYLHTSDQPSPGGGGYLLSVDYGSADNLIENNIHWNANKVMVMRASGGGNVIGYNYMEDGYIDYAKNYVESGINASHMTTSHMELFEGNESFNMDGDKTWGNSIYITGFRNHLTARRRSLGGLGLTDEGNRRAIGSGKAHWWYNYVGNVLGLAGQTLESGQTGWGYEWAGQSDSIVYMWSLGEQADGGQDPTVSARALRDGNYDYVTGTVKWHGIGGPDGTDAPTTLPDSLYLTSKPAFFGNNPWPWVDPTGATKLYTLPARARFDASSASPMAGP